MINLHCQIRFHNLTELGIICMHTLDLILMDEITGARLLPGMCPLAEMSADWGVETVSLPLCQPVWNPAQGNFRMSLCFGRLSSSSSPVILWSSQASCSLPHSLSTLMVSDGRKDGFRKETKVSYSPCPFPPTGPFLSSHPRPLLKILSQVAGDNPLVYLRYRQRPFQQGPVLVPLQVQPVVSVSNQGRGQHLWISHHAAVEGCQNMPIPYLNIAISGMKTISRVLLLHLQVLSPLSLTAEPPRRLFFLFFLLELFTTGENVMLWVQWRCESVCKVILQLLKVNSTPIHHLFL